MKTILTFILLTLYLSIGQAFQSTEYIYFEKKFLTQVRTAPGHPYLQLHSSVWTNGITEATKHILLYNYETQQAEFFEDETRYTAFSPNQSYVAKSAFFKSGKKAGYLNSSSGRNAEAKGGGHPSEDYKILEVFNDGTILGSKAKIDKTGFVKELYGLYTYDAKTYKSVEIFDKKFSPFGKFDKFPSHFSINQEYFWTDKAEQIEIIDFANGRVKSVTPKLDELQIINLERILAVGTDFGVVRLSVFGESKIYYEALVDPNTGKAELIGEGTEVRKDPFVYIGLSKVYKIFIEERKVEVFDINGGKPQFSTSYSFETLSDQILDKEYFYIIGGDEKLTIVPSGKGKGEKMLVFDLKTSAIEHELPLFDKTKKRPTVVASTAPKEPLRKMYNSTFLNSFDPLRLPFFLDYNTLQGREVTKPDGNDAYALGLLGETAEGFPIVLMMRRYQYSFSDITRFEVAIYDEESNLKALKEIGVTQKDGEALNVIVDFAIRPSGNTLVINAIQKNGNSNRDVKITVNKSTGQIIYGN